MGLPEPPGGWTSTCWSKEGILFTFYQQWKPLKVFSYPPPGDALSRGYRLSRENIVKTSSLYKNSTNRLEITIEKYISTNIS
ncbi:hypothetical protein TNCV_3728301 [Trichonephila clavipes]|nr:hypothetical protein TNCV_3728301 [Trichonephila clavipes]